MQAFLHLLPLLASFVPTSAAPSQALEARDPQCGMYDSVYAGSYSLNTNEWGEATGAGSQCSQINGLNGNSLAWQTTWSWENNVNNVKAYTNVASSSTSCQQISSISSIPTSWSWSYTGSDIRANVCYDTFVGSSCDGAQNYEVMVWLGLYGSDLYPLSNNGYPPTPTASPYIGETQFNLIIGTNEEGTNVYTFVAIDDATDYSGDLLAFYNYLEANEDFPANYYIQSITAGSEVFTGSDATLSTYGYSISQS